MEIGLSLGSNLGDRLKNLSAAKASIASIDGVRILASSSVYETEPVDVADEFKDKPFLNAVLILASTLQPKKLFPLFRRIEKEMGRAGERARNAPRIIDIDLIYAENETIDAGGLIVPHPRWAGRRFVVRPLAEVRPDLVIPGEARAVKKVLLSLPNGAETALLAESW